MMSSIWVECSTSVYRCVHCLAPQEHSPQHLIPEGKAFYKTLWFRRADSNASCCLAILTRADMTERMLTCVDMQHCTCTHTGLIGYWLIFVSVYVPCGLCVTCISATMLSSGFMCTVKASLISLWPSYRISISTKCSFSPSLNSTS